MRRPFALATDLIKDDFIIRDGDYDYLQGRVPDVPALDPPTWQVIHPGYEDAQELKVGGPPTDVCYQNVTSGMNFHAFIDAGADSEGYGTLTMTIITTGTFAFGLFARCDGAVDGAKPAYPNRGWYVRLGNDASTANPFPCLLWRKDSDGDPVVISNYGAIGTGSLTIVFKVELEEISISVDGHEVLGANHPEDPFGGNTMWGFSSYHDATYTQVKFDNFYLAD